MEVEIYLCGYTKRCNRVQSRVQNLIGYDKSLIERRTYMVLIEHYNFLHPLHPTGDMYARNCKATTHTERLYCEEFDRETVEEECHGIV